MHLTTDAPDSGSVAHLRDIVIDCHHPASLARFWAAVLDGYAVAAYDQQELARLNAAGIASPENDPTVLVEAASGASVRYWFQQVPEPKTVKNRVHLDLGCQDVDAEMRRLKTLGARVVAEHPSLTVLADPEDNEFCLLH